MTREEWIKIYNAKDGTWEKDDLIDKAYEIIASTIKTNYDRIKSMSVEEMAEFIDKNYKCRKCAYYNKCCNGDCTNGIIQWLLQEVNEDE